MAFLRCPHPSHGERRAGLKATYERVFECEEGHRFYQRAEDAEPLLVDLISGLSYRPEPLVAGRSDDAPEAASLPRLNFMVDVPVIVGTLDFDRLSLSAAEWKIISRIDGRCSVEEIRLLARMKAEEVERVLHGLIGAGLVEIRSRR